MPDILLTTLNAKYIHAAFGLRYLQANLGELRAHSHLMEFDINQRPADVAEAILARDARIVGFGVYIWNVALTEKVVSIIKRIRPETIIVVGGPEVSFEWQDQRVVQLADYLITGEADLEFARLCRQLLEGSRPAAKVIHAQPPEFSELALPYALYTDEDVAHRIIYVEASRGCPFRCEFCLSSLDVPVRAPSVASFLDALQGLIDRGVRHFKFVDRTFNLNVETSTAILTFCLQRCQPGMLFHFEMIPDRLPEPLRELVGQFPPGSLQFEVGVQTLNPDVETRISRRQNHQRLEENLRFLRDQTDAHIHADLILGLPGETLESIAAGFDRLVSLRPHEIQVGILKRLRGTPIARHDQEWGMIYNPDPPYDLLRNRLLDFSLMQRLKRFARYWDLVANSGNFVSSTPLIWTKDRSPFQEFLAWSDWLYSNTGRTSSIALPRLTELLFRYLTEEQGLPAAATAEAIWTDYGQDGRRDLPAFLREHIHRGRKRPTRRAGQRSGLKRQALHSRSTSTNVDLPAGD